MSLVHFVFNGQARLLKCFLKDVPGHLNGLHYQIEAHDVGVNDQYVQQGQDVYGSKCKCPPGTGYVIGQAMACATRLPDGSVKRNNDDDQAYGCWFFPLGDSQQHSFAQHGRAGVGIHGGGSDLPDSFAWRQGWEYTLGCIRLQNWDLERKFYPTIEYAYEQHITPTLDVVWP